MFGALSRPNKSSLHTASAFAQVLTIACVELQVARWPSYYMVGLVYASIIALSNLLNREALYILLSEFFPPHPSVVNGYPELISDLG